MTKRKSNQRPAYVELLDEDLYAQNGVDHLVNSAAVGRRRLDQLSDAETQLKQIRELRRAAGFDELIQYIETTPLSPLLTWLLIESASTSAKKGGVAKRDKYVVLKARVLAAWEVGNKTKGKEAFARHWEYKLREEHKLDKTKLTVTWHQIAKEWLPKRKKGHD
nr:hypothetical protein [uncultured Rhodoferax sp.]